MKRSFIPLTLCISLSAHASYFQTYCTDAETTTRWASGHSENFVSVTSRKWLEGERIERQLIFSSNEVLVETASKQEVDNQFERFCKEGQDWGYATWNKKTLVKSKISLTNGEAFEDNVVNVNDEGKIEGYFFCEEKGNSRIMCTE